MDYFYAQRAAAFTAQAEAAERQVRRYSNLRLALFSVAILLFIIFRDHGPATLITLGVATLMFALLVRTQRRHRERRRHFTARAGLCRVGVARHRRTWKELPVVIREAADAAHPYAGDLDLLGAPAVSQLFGPVYTLHGQRTLRGWLLEAADMPMIEARQQAVQELSRDIDFRELLAVEAQRIDRASHRRLEQFMSWVARVGGKPLPTVMIWLVRALPVASIALMIVHSAGLTERSWWLVPLAISAALSALYLRRIYAEFDAAFSREPAPLAYAPVFAIAERAPGGSNLLQQLRGKLLADGHSAAQRIRTLERIMMSSDARRAGILAMIFEVVFLWSFHVLIALQRWRAGARTYVPDWFAALGELEALSSMATLTHDNRAWCFPHVDAAVDSIVAEGIGHPMLADAVRVANDIRVGPPGTLLLITGSNMSGKSTLLRSLGVNTVLAHAGAPVCALQYRTPHLRLYSSVNVQDSLAQGVSLYMAQLKRLQQIVEAARATPADELTLYLLDEILSGTNSADRTAGVRAVVHYLMQTRSIGVLATHDLALANDAKLQQAATFIHFSDHFDAAARTMSFDYRIRPGPVRTSNALELMRLLGLPVE